MVWIEPFCVLMKTVNQLKQIFILAGAALVLLKINLCLL
jgi:hypothetical protein